MVCFFLFYFCFLVEDLNFYLPSYTAAACILYALNLTVHPDLSDVALRSVTRIQHLLKLEAVGLSVDILCNYKINLISW